MQQYPGRPWISPKSSPAQQHQRLLSHSHCTPYSFSHRRPSCNNFFLQASADFSLSVSFTRILNSNNLIFRFSSTDSIGRNLRSERRMAGKREGPLRGGGGGPSRGSRIATAVAIGITLGCVCAFLFPDGFFRFNSPPEGHTSIKSHQVCLILSYFCFSISPEFQLLMCYFAKKNEWIGVLQL